MCVWWVVCVCVPSKELLLMLTGSMPWPKFHYRTPAFRDANLLRLSLNFSLLLSLLFQFQAIVPPLTSLITCLLGLSSEPSLNFLIIYFLLSSFTSIPGHHRPSSHYPLFSPPFNTSYLALYLRYFLRFLLFSLLFHLSTSSYTISGILRSLSCFQPIFLPHLDE